VVETFPGRRADRDVAHEADRAIGETFAHVDDLAVGMVIGLKGALVQWVEGTVHRSNGSDVLETSPMTWVPGRLQPWRR
jgi:hypothetical protein